MRVYIHTGTRVLHLKNLDDWCTMSLLEIAARVNAFVRRGGPIIELADGDVVTLSPRECEVATVRIAPDPAPRKGAS